MYTAKSVQQKTGKGTWDIEKVSIFATDKKIGEFLRNYHRYGVETFAPFKRNDNWYALYSPDYTSVQVMELPSCKNIGGQIPSGNSFCPIEILIPRFRVYKIPAYSPELLAVVPKQNRERALQTRYMRTYELDADAEPDMFLNDDPIPSAHGGWSILPNIYYSNYAFAQGCIWGDDSCMKLTVLDISRAHEGVVARQLKADGYKYYEQLMQGKLRDLILMEDSFDDPNLDAIIGEDIFDFSSLADIINELREGDISMPNIKLWFKSRICTIKFHLCSIVCRYIFQYELLDFETLRKYILKYYTGGLTPIMGRAEEEGNIIAYTLRFYDPEYEKGVMCKTKLQINNYQWTIRPLLKVRLCQLLPPEGGSLNREVQSKS